MKVSYDTNDRATIKIWNLKTVRNGDGVILTFLQMNNRKSSYFRFNHDTDSAVTFVFSLTSTDGVATSRRFLSTGARTCVLFVLLSFSRSMRPFYRKWLHLEAAYQEEASVCSGREARIPLSKVLKT